MWLIAVVVNKTSSNTIILTFSGCFADSFIYTYTTPVTVVETPTPNADTPTPVPTSTFTPVPPTPTDTPCPSCSYNVTKERQCATPWGSTVLGGFNIVENADGTQTVATICNSGCLLTCISMVDNTTPNVLNNFYTQNEDYTPSGGLVVSTAAGQLGWVASKHAIFTPDQMESAICGGLKVIAHVNDYTHFVTVTGQQFDPTTGRCRMTIADPNNSSTQFLDDPSITEVDDVYTINTGSGL